MQLLPQTTIAAAGTYTSQVVDFGGQVPRLLTAIINFLYGAGGTTVNVYLQTSFDGVTFYDVISYTQITTAASKQLWSIGVPAATQTASLTDGTMTAGTGRTGVIGRYWRLKYIVVGTYTGATSLQGDIFGSLT